MKDLYEMTKAELVEKVMAFDSRETLKRAKSQTKPVLINWIEMYRKYNPLSCKNCIKRGKTCPWDGSYQHKGENGEEIGICNAYE